MLMQMKILSSYAIAFNGIQILNAHSLMILKAPGTLLKTFTIQPLHKLIRARRGKL